MTYREDFTLPAELLERVSKQGFDILPKDIGTMCFTKPRQSGCLFQRFGTPKMADCGLSSLQTRASTI
ncbi:MAG: hypothetical protein NTV38_07585 [Chloroflexi bacterium]|nr:hypothetical protein [Chloroflexota bacterium]